MDRNIGPEDRVVRIVVGLGLALIAYLGIMGTIATIVAGVAAVYLLVTGFLGVPDAAAVARRIRARLRR